MSNSQAGLFKLIPVFPFALLTYVPTWISFYLISIYIYDIKYIINIRSYG